MKLIILANRLSKFSRCLPKAVINSKPLVSSTGLKAYLFENGEHHLHFVEVEEIDTIVIKYEKKSIALEPLPLQEIHFSIGKIPCLIIVHHWGRGRTFQINNTEPELQVLQIGFNGQWNIISRDPCIAVASGGSDPISDLLQCFFANQNGKGMELRKIEERLWSECQS